MIGNMDLRNLERRTDGVVSDITQLRRELDEMHKEMDKLDNKIKDNEKLCAKLLSKMDTMEADKKSMWNEINNLRYNQNNPSYFRI